MQNVDPIEVTLSISYFAFLVWLVFIGVRFLRRSNNAIKECNERIAAKEKKMAEDVAIFSAAKGGPAIHQGLVRGFQNFIGFIVFVTSAGLVIALKNVGVSGVVNSFGDIFSSFWPWALLMGIILLKVVSTLAVVVGLYHVWKGGPKVWAYFAGAIGLCAVGYYAITWIW